jgi:hypothetical protein
MVFFIEGPTEVAIQKMIEASQRMLKVNSQGELGGINPVMKKHLELEIKTLENAPRDAEKLERLLQVKKRQKEEAMQMEDTERLVTERLKCSRLYCIWSAEIEDEILFVAEKRKTEEKKKMVKN